MHVSSLLASEKENKAARIAQPARSTVESLGKNLNRVHRRCPLNLKALKTEEKWATITPEQYVRVVPPYGRCFEVVITTKGFCTRY